MPDSVESNSIGWALLIETVIVVILSAGLALVWDVHSGFSALVGAMAYILPYTLAYVLFFGVLPGGFSLLGKAFSAKKRRYIAGGFAVAELVKIIMTMGILLSAFYIYRQANWAVLLLSFVLAIGINWAVLFCVCGQGSQDTAGSVNEK